MIATKIKNITQLKKTIERLKSQGKKIVFTNGCFDLLHYGHVMYLQGAKKKGDILVVGINSDSSVRRIKGKKRPIVNEVDRSRLVAALESVDYVVLFKENTPLEIIKHINPDVLVKGADWKKHEIVGSRLVSRRGGCVSTIKFAKGYSTSNLIKKIAKRF